MAKRYAWTRNSDDEIWRGGPCDSIKECVEEALDEGLTMEDTFAIGYIEEYKVDCTSFADDIIERLCEDAYDEVGEVSYDWLSCVARLETDKLNSRILEVVKQWLEEINEEPWFYKVLPCEECTLEEAMEIHNKKVANMSRGGKIDV